MACRLGIGLILGAGGVFTLACSGGDDKAPTSTIVTPGGAGGMAGAAGSFIIGNGAISGSVGSGGLGNPEPPTIGSFHICGRPEQECGVGTHTGDVKAVSKADLEPLEGIGAIDGNLEIRIGSGTVGLAELLDDLVCLRTISGDLTIEFSNTEGDVSLWGLRNLTSVGGKLVVSNTFTRTFADCGFTKLQNVGTFEGTGQLEFDRVGGDLDLSSLLHFSELRIHDTELVSVKLPTSGTFALSYLQISHNAFLSQISGFEDVLVQFLPGAGTAGVQLLDNPRLSDCRASALAKLFTSGGAQPTQITQSGNLPCTAP